MAQNSKNFRQFYAPHHFVFYPVSLILLGLCIHHALHDGGYIWWMAALLTCMLIALSFMMRQHYALGLQDRIIRLEMRHKYFVLTGKDFEKLESKLSFKQVAALRFASDDQLPELVEQAIAQNLGPQQIRDSIKNWKPDLNRV